MVDTLKSPVTATSANGSGEKRPYTIQDIFDGLSEKQKSLIDLIIDAGELPHRPPSTVIDTTLSTPVVFRQGDIEIGQHQSTTTLTSHSETETKQIAQRLLLKHWNDVKETGLVIGLNGSLGMGKTIFVKGVAEFLFIPQTITSPTYTYVQEYEFDRHQVTGKLAHFDVWKIAEPSELDRLGLHDFLRPNTVTIIEWVSMVGEYLQNVFREKTMPYMEVTFREINGSDNDHSLQRELVIKE